MTVSNKKPDSKPKGNKRQYAGTIQQVNQRQLQAIDHVTGQVLYEENENQKTIGRVVVKDQFMKIYSKQIATLAGLSSPLAYRVLFYLWSIAEYNTNKVVFLVRHREAMKEQFNVTQQSVYNAMSALVKANLLIKGKYKQEYILNPEYFFYGDDIEKSNVLKLVLEYHIVDNVTEDDNGKEV